MKKIKLNKWEILSWASKYKYVAFYNSCDNVNDKYYSYDCLIAVANRCVIAKKVSKYGESDLFEQLEELQNKSKNWLFGYLGYDLKNEVEQLFSKNEDHLAFPDLFFFEPEILLLQKNGTWEVENKQNEINFENLKKEIESSNTGNIYSANNASYKINNRLDYASYQKKIEAIKADIENGIYYELNFCREFYAEHTNINPYQVFKDLCHIAEAPMAAFLKMNNQFVISASPERFLKKTGDKLVAQPMKGTMKRSKDEAEDEILKKQLKNSEKERAENVMIVDLMRNDLTRSAKLGSITVERLFDAVSYNGFHTLVSTVSANIAENISSVKAIKNAFPIGSMTGAPKVRVLEKIEAYENTKRGVYAGAIGYFMPNGDFDFNVVIRTLLYNSLKQYLSFTTGGAIVFDSKAAAEFEETELKAANILKVLNSK